MSGGQIAALVFAILLLLPGGCYLIFGIGFLFNLFGQPQYAAVAYELIRVGLALLALTGLLFWLAFRRRRG